jgi:hypothetical protein
MLVHYNTKSSLNETEVALNYGVECVDKRKNSLSVFIDLLKDYHVNRSLIIA